VASEVGVAACELVCKGGEYSLEFSPIEIIPGTEEAGPEGSIGGNRFRERLSDCGFPCARQPVQPKHVLVPWIPRPE
jgi:hypothetical protein